VLSPLIVFPPGNPCDGLTGGVFPAPPCAGLTGAGVDAPCDAPPPEPPEAP
jgi:hypothetical protein